MSQADRWQQSKKTPEVMLFRYGTSGVQLLRGADDDFSPVGLKLFVPLG